MSIQNKKIFPGLNEKNRYNKDSLECIQKIVANLIDKKLDSPCPGMLLGKIQSGKTKTFIGVIGLAFDEYYDYCIILTKNTKALVQQTRLRLESEFTEPCLNDSVRIYDIMRTNKNLTPYVLEKKLIFIAKKQSQNLKRLIKFFEEYPTTKEKKVLIIDDEADYASIGFQKSKTSEEEISLRTIADQIGQVRSSAKTDFLQVTATPYALYLQPNKEFLNLLEILPTRPKFTQLVPIHDQYVGGKVYFEAKHEKTNEDLPWAKFLHIEVPVKEIDVLGKPDQRYINNILTTPNLQFFRLAIVNFLVSGAIRAINENGKQYKCSFIIHTETAKLKHHWQHELTKALIKSLRIESSLNSDIFINLINESIANLAPSLVAANIIIPSHHEITSHLNLILGKHHIVIHPINSDNDILTLLDSRTGQLSLDNPFNIFVGGQILDRGVTIENLLGFFYGRNPKRFQQDTLLQHSRMYGARSMNDLAVTRLYTTARLHGIMKKMHEFDAALRVAFEKGHGQDGVVFLEKDPKGEIRPCSNSKILIPFTTTLTAHKRFLPIGFQTKPKSILEKKVSSIDRYIENNLENIKSNHYLISSENARHLLELIFDTFVYSKKNNNEEYFWNLDEMLAILERTCNSSGKINCIAARDRNMSRFLADNRTFSDAPDGTLLYTAREVAIDTPCLILTRQNGSEDLGWNGHPFWWPILITPANTKTAIFSHSTPRIN